MGLLLSSGGRVKWQQQVLPSSDEAHVQQREVKTQMDTQDKKRKRNSSGPTDKLCLGSHACLKVSILPVGLWEVLYFKMVILVSIKYVSLSVSAMTF